MKQKSPVLSLVPLTRFPKNHPDSGHWVRFGSYFRKSDSKYIARFRCSFCGRTRSQATDSPCYRQKKRRINRPLFYFLASGGSQRRAALTFHVNQKTIVRKFLFLGLQKFKEHEEFLSANRGKSKTLSFDEVETSEHSKWKPLSVALAVNERRQGLGVQVSQMPARGRDAARAREKYGPRKDERRQGIERLLTQVAPCLTTRAPVLTDEKKLYKPLVKRFLPEHAHHSFKGRRACVAGQGELKEGGWDPLFPLNHTAAMLRANINRLFRRTWCLTKKPERLLLHLYLYLSYHNQVLVPRAERIRRKTAQKPQ